MTTIAERAAAFVRRRIFRDLAVMAVRAPIEAEEARNMDVYLRHVAERPFIAPDVAPCTCSYDHKRNEVHFAGRRGLLAVLSRNGLESVAEWNARLDAEKADRAVAASYVAAKGEITPPEPPVQRNDNE